MTEDASGDLEALRTVVCSVRLDMVILIDFLSSDNDCYACDLMRQPLKKRVCAIIGDRLTSQLEQHCRALTTNLGS